MLTLIGSTAARKHFPDFREPKDVDFHTGDANQAAAFMQAYRNEGEVPPDVFVDPRLVQWNWGPVASPEELYTMKVSHSFWEINRDPNNWNKHMADVIFFQRKGVEFIRELYDILKPIWKDIHEPHRTSLKQNKANFFNDAVVRKYDHDSIHASIAYGDHPLYEDILVPGEEVMVDNSKFFDGMDHETKLKCVREEVYATALERILIPKNYKGSPGAAYAWALRRTITSLFKGEWALWTVLNYDILARPDCNYLQRHLDNADKLILLEEK
jgi:hypothetical protein